MVFINSFYDQYSNNDNSTLYSPFTQRPEIIEDDYIPLPTVTRNYIDPPPDSIIDSLPYPFRVRRPAKQKLQQYANILSPLTPTKKAILNPKRHSIDNGHMAILLASNHINHTVPPKTDPWLITRRNSISIETHVSKKMCW